ncbi:MAG: DUF1385 domain-containing protein, partial [Deltaproteobacteria bacterium]|nr:DUF1385 domain-containing protein [Deltaproteobacteria bacterium]
MMRSPRSFTVAVRRKDGRIVVRESRWVSLSERFRVLRWPFFRGTVVLLESLHNGLSALTWSAQIAEAGAAGTNPSPLAPPPAGTEPGAVPSMPVPPVPQAPLPAPALWLTIAVAFLMAIGLFAALPHLLTWLLGLAFGSESLQGGRSLAFHLVDGAVKAVILVGYMAAISLLPDVRRLFMYHGAEHRAIHAYEHGLPLTVETAQGFT